MDKNYSRSAFKWHIYPLFSFLAMILLSAIAFITTRIAALSGVTDFLFLIYLLIIILLPAIFALCGIASLVFSMKALRNREPKSPILGNLLIAFIYLAVGLYYTYHFTYQVLIA